MTVSEIKEYIEKIKSDIYSAYYSWGELQYSEEEMEQVMKRLDEIIKSLDELERPNAKWIIDEYGDYHCEKCNAIIEKDEWGRHNYNYCYHCGARM